MLVRAGILASLIVGAGMFSLPHVFVRAGLAYGLAALVFFTWVSISLNSRYAGIIDRDGTDNRFAGYARKHLGNKGYAASLVFVLGGIAFTLAVYVALAPSFFSLVLPMVPGSASAAIFWIAGTAIAFMGTKRGSATSLAVFSAMMAIIAFFGIFALFKGDAGNIASAALFDPRNLFLPFGPLLFSLSGRSALSSIREGYEEKDYSMPKFLKAIRLGAIIPAAIYAAFIAITIALSGHGVTPDAVSGLTMLPAWGLAATGVLGILAILDSYALLGMEFVGIVSKDIKVPKALSYALFAAIPPAIYFLGSSDFLTLIGITGGIFLAAESIMVVLMGRKAFGGRFSDLPLIAVFVFGMIYEISGLFR
jgi:hypothetical protein